MNELLKQISTPLIRHIYPGANEFVDFTDHPFRTNRYEAFERMRRGFYWGDNADDCSKETMHNWSEEGF